MISATESPNASVERTPRPAPPLPLSHPQHTEGRTACDSRADRGRVPLEVISESAPPVRPVMTTRPDTKARRTPLARERVGELGRHRPQRVIGPHVQPHGDTTGAQASSEGQDLVR